MKIPTMKMRKRHLIILMTLVVALLGGTGTAWAAEWNPANTAHWKGTYEIYAGKTYTINTQVKMDGNLTLNATGTGTATIQRGSSNTALLISTEASHKLIINGTASCRVVIDGVNKSGVKIAISLFSTSTAGHEFNYVTFRRCTRAYTGGTTGSAIYINQTATFNNCIFENCTSQKGGATLVGANTTFNSCIFRNNQGANGGAVYVGASDEGKTGKATFNDCTFQDNSINPASGYGGAIYIESNGNSAVDMYNCTITGNTAKSGGGGIYKLGPLTVSGTLKVTGNTSGGVTNNVHIGNNTTMTIATAGLSCGSSIGATKTSATNIATGTAANCAYAYRNHFFFSDPGTYQVFNTNTSPYYNNTTGTTLYLIDNATANSALNSWHNSADASGCTISDGYVTHINNAAGLAYFSKDVLTKDYSGKTVYLTTDINLSGHNWEPIGYLNDCPDKSGKAFKGIFDGQGHSITGMNCPYQYYNMGLFGWVDGGTVKNTMVAGTVGSNQNNADNNGGLVGYLQSGSVYNCVANVTPTGGTNVGGLVGEVGTGGSLKNSYAIVTSGNGLAGKNSGTVENCYVRGTSTLVGSGTTNYCYASDGTQTGTNGTFTATQTPYLYKHYDNQVSGSNTYIPTGDNKQLVATLNNWVNGQGSNSGYATWMRTCASPVNDDYPLFNFPNYECVGFKTNSNAIEYGLFNTKFNQYVTANTGTIYLYNTPAVLDATTDAQANVSVSNSGTSTKLYIGEHVALKPTSGTGDIDATVGITLDNSAGANGAHPTQGGTDAMDWHMFSTPLTAAPLGINYEGNTTEYPFSWGHPSVGGSAMPYWHFYDDAANHGYFPSHQYNTTYDGSVSTTATAGGNYYNDWDFYTYYEPEYHWINFKRNGHSHWHEDYPDVRINYKSNGTGGDWTNEPHLIKGQGYLLSTVEPTYLQCSGTLTQGEVTRAVTASAWQRKGYNLLGNPYQSYLDFNAFATANGIDSYYIIDEDAPIKGYAKYTKDASVNEYIASSYIHPHQGFMVIVPIGKTVQFTDAMRVTALPTGITSNFRGGERIAYPLVNLIATEENGTSDVCTVELDRPDRGGAPVMRNLRICKGLVYCRYDDEDWSIAFTRPGLSEVPIRFETTADAEFTMTWDMENADFGYLHLIDNTTGADIDCLTETEYRFSAKTTDYASRFRLVFEYTGIDEGEAPEPVEGPTAFAFQMGGQIVVNGEGTLQIVDLTGRVLATHELHGTQSTVAVPQGAAGVYVLRLAGANGTRIQKIVIS